MSVIVADTLNARVAGAAVTTEKGLNVGGALTATSFIGDGSNLTGVTGFATALDSSGFLSKVFQTQKLNQLLLAHLYNLQVLTSVVI